MAVTAEAQFHILAVDDSLIDRKLIERLLRTSSYQVTTVDSGSKALELLGLQDGGSDDSPSRSASNQEIAVNLVITDYCMPGMTGYDLLKKIKESSPLKDIPVVIMSSENVPSRISRCLEGGAEEFFLKPVQLSDMAKLVPHIMKGKSREQQKGQAEQSQPVPQETPPPQHERTNYSDQITATTTQKNSSNSNKRKTMEEGLPPERSLSPERTRPRYTVAA